ncbi:MAG: hypothetical protein GKR90_03255 [Pseudomonadales bacterium]|nr:hypothetical protein [Pseudomonadales bacterium]
MKRYIAAGLAVFLISIIAFAPASLVARFIQPDAQLALLEPRGSVWNGTGLVVASGQQLGQINWTVDTLSLLTLAPRVHWQLEQPLLEIHLTTVGVNRVKFSVNGTADLELLKPLLHQYDLFIPGTINMTDITGIFTVEDETVDELDGTLNWSGGLVRYVLSGQFSESNLPELKAELSAPVKAEVTTHTSPTHLLEAELTNNGFVKIGITKMLTKMLNRPWPGSDPDHAVVLVVEEQLF